MINPPPKHDHPAVFSRQLWPHLIDELEGYEIALDPFAGVGTIHELAKAAEVPFSIGVELEREWANVDLYPTLPRMQIVADFLTLSMAGAQCDVVCTSTTYGNRMADHHDAQERCRACHGTGYVAEYECAYCGGRGHREYTRNTYRHRLGRPLTKGNSGQMQWGDGYRHFHEVAWKKCYALLTQLGGMNPKLVLNIKDHYRKNKLVQVTEWHKQTLLNVGFRFVRSHNVEVLGNRYGQNGKRRTGYETILVVMK